MTILVTGAGGGLGRILCEALRQDGSEPIVCSARAQASSSESAACDVTEREAVRALLRRVRPRLVFHLAGSFSNDYAVDYAVNAQGAIHLLEGLRAESPAARVVLMGSAAEYGVIRPEDNPIAEDRALRPVSVYGLTKAFQTQIGLYHAHAFGSDVVVARLFNLEAPGLSERLFVGRMERMIRRYKDAEISTIEVGNLESRRDYVTGGQAVAQVCSIAAKGEKGGIYHVGSGKAVSMREILYKMLDAADIPRHVIKEAVPDAGGRTGYDAPIIFADTRRTRALEHSPP